jgi:glycerol uptake facilitator-like aquaporin
MCTGCRDGRGVVLLIRRSLAELVGTALLVIAIVGSGIAAQRLSPSDPGLDLLENALATGTALVAIILAIGSVSGAHLNPLISAVDTVVGGLRWRELPAYAAAQLAGACAGSVVANLMFSLPAVQISHKQRSSPGLWLAESVATFGLLLVVFGIARSRRPEMAAFAVGAYITGAYFFTASTSFANPAVTVARALSDTFAGIAPGSVVGFVIFQVVGAGLALGAIRVLYPAVRDARQVVVHPQERAS